MELAICVTTVNRPWLLAECLQAIANSTSCAALVVVSDDSSAESTIRQNRDLVYAHPGWVHVLGPRKGVCANRNNALGLVRNAADRFVAFVDDDICVDSAFVDRALRRYEAMDPESRRQTILSGVSVEADAAVDQPTRLDFHCYFRPTEQPENVAIHAGVFPMAAFPTGEEWWDPRITFGLEDAELSLRLRARGFRIKFCPELIGKDRGVGLSVLSRPGVARLSEYEVAIEAARLYVGVKRYLFIERSYLRLSAFVSFWLSHMVVWLLRRCSIKALPTIVRRANLHLLVGRPARHDRSTKR